MTATPERLHLMVVDASLRFARQAADAMREGKIDLAYSALNRSRACVNEMALSVNADPNPELAGQFKALLAYVYKNLALADFRRDVSLIEESIRILEIHRETWVELLGRLSQEQGILPVQSVPLNPQQGRPLPPAYGDTDESQLSLVG